MVAVDSTGSGVFTVTTHEYDSISFSFNWIQPHPLFYLARSGFPVSGTCIHGTLGLPQKSGNESRAWYITTRALLLTCLESIYILVISFTDYCTQSSAAKVILWYTLSNMFHWLTYNWVGQWARRGPWYAHVARAVGTIGTLHFVPSLYKG